MESEGRPIKPTNQEDGGGDDQQQQQFCQFAIDICQIMERNSGDDDNASDELHAMLDISVDDDDIPIEELILATTGRRRRVGIGDDNGDINNNFAISTFTTQKCQQLLVIFYSLLGHYNDNDDEPSAIIDDIRLDNVPLSVKPHLLLRALLRIPHDTIPW